MTTDKEHQDTVEKLKGSIREGLSRLSDADRKALLAEVNRPRATLDEIRNGMTAEDAARVRAAIGAALCDLG